MKSLGNYLREGRIKKGLTQVQVSDRLGYTSPQFISNIERGVSKIPVSSMKDFISLYALDPNELVEHFLNEKRKEIKQLIGLPINQREVQCE